MLVTNGNVVYKIADGNAEYVVVMHCKDDFKLYRRRDTGNKKDNYQRYHANQFIVKDNQNNLVVIKTKKYTKVMPLNMYNEADYVDSVPQEEVMDDANDPMFAYTKPYVTGATPKRPAPPIRPDTQKPTVASNVMSTNVMPNQGQMTNQGQMMYEEGDWFGNRQGNANVWFGPEMGGNVVPGTHIGNAGRPFARNLGGNVVPGTTIRNSGRPFAGNLGGDVVPGTNISNRGPIFGSTVGNRIPPTSQQYAVQQGVADRMSPVAGQVYGLQQGQMPAVASSVYAAQQGQMPAVASSVYGLQQGQPIVSQQYAAQQNGMMMPNPMTGAVGVIKNVTQMPMTIPAGFGPAAKNGQFQIKFPVGTFQAIKGKRILPGTRVTFQLYAGDTQELSQIVGRTGLNMNTIYVSSSSIPMGMGGYFTLPPNQQVYVYNATA